jgi:tetratricopeptide (TPR) repeat protein
MRNPSLKAGLLAGWLACVLPALAHEEASLSGVVTGDLGETTFPTSGAARAQPDFMRGLLQLHSFEFDAARESFQAAIEKDPGFAMAYWGEALSFNMPIWGEQDLVAARAVLERLAPTVAERLAKAPTERERDYLASVEQLYGDGDKTERDANYSAALGAMSRKYPDDLDARSFYALSLLALTGTNRDTGNYMRGAAEAEAVYEINPRHPGALHYLIHAYDDPVHAPLGLRAARRYGKVASAAAHAQHMPSHIFFALGLWDDAIEANIASLATARSQGRGGYHPLEWLAYAYLQEGRQDQAAELVKIVEQDVAAKPTQGNRPTLASLRATWLIETGGAPGVDGWPEVDSAGIASTGAFVAQDFCRGLMAARAGKLDLAAANLARLRARTDAARERIAGVVANRYDTVTPEEIEYDEIMAVALDGAIQFARGEHDAGLAAVREAIATADTIAFAYGPPWSVKPLDELLGDLLMQADKPAEAVPAYDKALSLHPNRRLAREGLLAAQAVAWKCQHCADRAEEPAGSGVGPQ